MLRFVLLSIAAAIIAYWVRQLIMRIVLGPRPGPKSPPSDAPPKQEAPKVIDLDEDEDGVFRPRDAKDKSSNKDDKA